MSTPKRVLLVEDAEDSRHPLMKLLELEGYEVVEAADGRQAVDLAIEAQPDVIVMDVSLPVVDGLTAAKTIKEQQKLTNIPIIALSGHEADDINSSVSPRLWCDYLTKPVDFDRLKRLIAKLLSE